MDHKRLVVIGVLGIASIAIWMWYFKRNHYATPPKRDIFSPGATGYVVPVEPKDRTNPKSLDPQDPSGLQDSQDPQDRCEARCFGSEYYDACMHTCMDPEGIYDFGVPISPPDEISPYRYETPGK